MHYPTILLALFASAVVASKEPWACSYPTSDCTGPNGGDSATLKFGDCVPVNFKNDNIKFNFGSGLDETTVFGIYSDPNCKVQAGDNINSTVEGTPAQCISRNEHSKVWGTAAWGSIMVME